MWLDVEMGWSLSLVDWVGSDKVKLGYGLGVGQMRGGVGWALGMRLDRMGWGWDGMDGVGMGERYLARWPWHIKRTQELIISSL